MTDFSKFSMIQMGLAGVFALAASGAAVADENPDISIPQNLEVELSGYLDESAFTKASMELYRLRAENPNDRIRVNIGDTRGGELEAGFSFATTLNEVAPVDLVCAGNLQSMAANLFVSWQGGERIADEDCTNFMLHDIIYTVPSQSIGKSSFVREYVTEVMVNLKIPFAMMTQATANASGLSLESAEALFGFDCHLTPEKAYSLNLLDSFEGQAPKSRTRLHNPSPEDIHTLCDTLPMKGYFGHTDWSRFNFNGVTAPALEGP